jgi:hypothetical protein
MSSSAEEVVSTTTQHVDGSVGLVSARLIAGQANIPNLRQVRLRGVHRHRRAGYH